MKLFDDSENIDNLVGLLKYFGFIFDCIYYKLWVILSNFVVFKFLYR